MRIITLFMLVALLGLSMYVVGVSITGRSASVLEYEIIGCSLNTNLDFMKIDNKEQVCFDGKKLHFSVENVGTGDISGMSVFLDADYDVTMVIRDEILQGAISQQDLSFGGQELSGIRMLTVYPVVGDGVHRTVCENSAISVEVDKC